MAEYLEMSKARIPGQNVQHAILRQIKISRSPIVKVSSSHSPSGERECLVVDYKGYTLTSCTMYSRPQGRKSAWGLTLHISIF